MAGSGLVLIEPSDLYNLLNQGTRRPALSDQTFLLLLDARCKEDYDESHVITAKKATKNESGSFTVPYEAELECRQHVIIYDGNTRSLKEEGPAVSCGKVMWEMGSRNPVHILKGGYEDFSALYPFLRTQKIIFMPRELDEIKTYPIEVIPGLLYLGNWRQGNAAYIQKDLKVKAHINCCVEKETFFQEEGSSLLHIPVEDEVEADIGSKIHNACTFIDKHKNEGNVVLVFSQLGISRSATIVIAYLMHHNKVSYREAFAHVLKCFSAVRPNSGFIKQLSTWEKELFNETPKVTKKFDADVEAILWSLGEAC